MSEAAPQQDYVVDPSYVDKVLAAITCAPLREIGIGTLRAALNNAYRDGMIQSESQRHILWRSILEIAPTDGYVLAAWGKDSTGVMPARHLSQFKVHHWAVVPQCPTQK